MASNRGSSETNDEEVRIVMVGKTGNGKSATGNTILGQKCFDSQYSAMSVTVNCSKGRAVVDGQQVAVIDTPGLFDTRFDIDKTNKDLIQCITYAVPGPHVFLVVIGVGRYTGEEKDTVQRIQKIFGEAAAKYSMVLFTHGDRLKGTSIEKFLKGSDLLELVDRCNGQYHVFNNENPEDRSQVTELFQKIRDVVRKNGGSHYTNEMFKEAERAIKEETERILKEEEEQIHKEEEKMERKLREKYEKMMKKMNEQAERERKEGEEERKRRDEEMERKERQEERKRTDEERERERKERVEEMKRERECMDKQRVEEAKERMEDIKREREMMEDRGRERESKEREAERNRHIEEKENMKKQHDRELRKERERVHAQYEEEARKEAEKKSWWKFWSFTSGKHHPDPDLMNHPDPSGRLGRSTFCSHCQN